MIQVPMNVTQGMIAQPVAYPAPQYVASQNPAPVYTEPDQKQYNAVSITVHKPTVEAGSTDNANQFNPYNYAQAPIYNYPQASVYADPMLAQYQQMQQPAAALPAYEASSAVLPAQPAQIPDAEPIVSDSQTQIPQSVIPVQEAPVPAETIAETVPVQDTAAQPEIQPQPQA